MATDENNNGKYPSWKWLVSILMGLLIFFGAQWATDVKARVQRVEENKLDKEQYYRDLSDMRKKLDCLYQWHLPKDLRNE